MSNDLAFYFIATMIKTLFWNWTSGLQNGLTLKQSTSSATINELSGKESFINDVTPNSYLMFCWFLQKQNIKKNLKCFFVPLRFALISAKNLRFFLSFTLIFFNMVPPLPHPPTHPPTHTHTHTHTHTLFFGQGHVCSGSWV